ncbi:hypothetical protein GTCCBUS3UF5_34660 [Geobacillus thermoleovorans CCB_US3_UF5]|uniref:Uncharacterized protein n=1 Tax=Geobacillus thermoleovorans CCB_US3_UF5 TaxID=1111068 RepID=A0ABM5MMB1_GEOTH|nr:hypothetical protein GTCCBUS3UF5_34660 [Geobacillus thermoleovorans CCB_US3_UF5]
MNISCFHLRPGSSLLRFDIDATKKFNISLMEKSLVHFSTVEGKPVACLRHAKA